ncbi:MAG: ribonuclease P protein component [Pirellulales bacterium]|nr:ribonuclease P protein component [Pirellulales bacterium]
MSGKYPKSRRLLRTAEFDRVFQRKRSRSDELLVLYGCRNDQQHSRLGLVVSRKVGNAVKRARWKRRLREAFRLSQQELPQGIDFVALPRTGMKPTMQAVRASMLRLAGRLAAALE